MKYILSLVGIIVVCFSFTFLKNENTEANCFCVCVISNSNSENDEKIKFAVNDRVSSYINKTAVNWSDDNLESISYIANQILSIYHCEYACDVEIKDEKIPNLYFVDNELKNQDCKTICIKLGNGFGEKIWQVFYE